MTEEEPSGDGRTPSGDGNEENTMIYGQQSERQTGSVWSIAMTAAMGNGIGPRSIEETPAPRSAKRWPWSRTAPAGEPMVVAPRT